MDQGLWSFSLAYTGPFVSESFVEKTVLFSLKFFSVFIEKSIDHICESLYLDSLFCSFCCLSIFSPMPGYLDNCSFISLKIRYCGLILSLQSCFGYSRYFAFLYILETASWFLPNKKKDCWDFDWYCIKYIDQFGEMCDVLAILTLPIQ